MDAYKFPFGPGRIRYLLPVLLVIASLACALPFSATPTPQPTAEPTASPTPPPPTPTPLPAAPALVESDPPVNADLPLEGPITLYFNQPMDRASVEAALSSQMGQGVAFNWVDDATLIVYMDQPLKPEMTVSLNLSDQMRSKAGKPMLQPIRLDYQAAGYLQIVQRLPQPGAAEVDPSAAVLLAFNRPVVPLAADPASAPAGFTLQPNAPGRGEWLNTSTYVFHPEPALAGGAVYTVQPNPALKSTDGGPLQDPSSWSFTTARPQIIQIEPVTETPWPLDAPVKLSFNQPMDPASVETNFSLTGPDGAPVAGTFTWNDAHTRLTFQPDSLLARGATYTLQLNAQALAAGGTPLDPPLSAQVIANPPLSVSRVNPAAGAELDPTSNLTLYLSAPLPEGVDLLQYIRMEPAVSDLSAWWYNEERSINLRGSFTPRTTYTLHISPDLPDAWGGSLGQEYVYTVTIGPLQPNLSITVPTSVVFVRPQDTALNVQAAGLSEAPLTLGKVGLGDFFALNGPNGYQMAESYQPSESNAWSQPLNLSLDRMETTQLYLSQDQAPLAPGLYYLKLNFPPAPGSDRSNIYGGPFYVVVSDVQITLKASADQALAWVVDLRSGAALPNAPVTLYDEDGTALAQGQTDDQGLFQASYAPLKDAYRNVYAVVAQPNDPNFSLTQTSWNYGVNPWDFGLDSNARLPGPQVYFYTDRPIYRPGQTVYFRAIARQAANGRYTPLDAASLPVKLYGSEGAELAALDLGLSAFGAAHGEYVLPDDAKPGSYSIQSPLDLNGSVSFAVASYRKPEINLEVAFTNPEIRSGDPLAATIRARYFFDAPAGNLKAHWALYMAPDYFSLPGYQVGPEDTTWLDPVRLPGGPGGLGTLVKEDDAQIGPDGTLALQLPTQAQNDRFRYTLEVTLTDESGLPVSARASAVAHPDAFYIGLRPDAWNGRAGEPAGFEALVVDWQSNAAGGQPLRAAFRRVTYRQIPGGPDTPFGLPQLAPEYTQISSTDFVPGPDGLARLSFTPPEPGTYQLDVYNPANGPEQGARTQALVWISGPGQANWPNLPNSRLRLVANQAAYRPGDTAQVFIPNPFGQPAPALLTVERSTVMQHEVVTIPAEGYTFNLPLTGEHAPNVYLSATLLGQNEQGVADFRQGYLNLPVAPVEQTLNVRLTAQPERAGPGDPVNFEIQVTDALGAPVQGEFSLAVVDLAALALADPNSPDIVSAFYGKQPNGVRTSLSLAAYARRLMDMPGGLGGGGGADIASVTRESFPDTAYWNAQVVTGADGKAQVSLDLPDSLTTWQVEARGLTEDTRVGQGQTQIVTTKDLLVRPVTPRFFVVNDHAQVAAVVQNNTANELSVEVSLQSGGFTLDEASPQTQSVTVPAQGRVRVEWWGTAQDAAGAELIFSASSGGLQDAARPALGTLPILRYLAPQTFRTSGALDQPGEQTELISLPRSYPVQGGDLQVELAPSLAAAMLRGLEALESAPFESNEQVVSSFLPNLETYRTLQQFGIEDPALKGRLDRSLNSGLQRLAARQNPDGGWSWWQETESDPFVTSYALFGLSRARLAGITVNTDLIQRAVQFLQSTGPKPSQDAASKEWPPQPYEWDRLAFRQYVLSLNSAADPALLAQITQNKAALSPWGQALLALALEQLTPGGAEAQAIFADLQAAAVRSATGAAWEMPLDENGLLARDVAMQSNLGNTAIVLFALAQHDPASPLVTDALRYLMANRDPNGGWNATYTTAWTLIALDEVIQSTGGPGGDFAFSASLNGNSLAQGQAAQGQLSAPVLSQTPVQRLYPDNPNVLTIQRGEGSGRLYYAIGLNISRAAEDVPPVSQGVTIERAIFAFGPDCTTAVCTPIQSASARQKATVRLTLTLPHDMHYLAVQDYIPAGAEIIDTRLNTGQQGADGQVEVIQTVDPRQPTAEGQTAIWRFGAPQVYDDHIAWAASYLPAGTYQLSYTIALLQPGQYRLLPARAWQLYFPEVYGNTAGATFEIKP